MTKCLTGKTHHLQQTWTEQQIWIRLFDILVWRQHAWRAAEATQMAFCHHLTLYLPHNFISDLTSSKKHEGLWHQKHVCLCLSAVLNPKTFAAFLKKKLSWKWWNKMKQNKQKRSNFGVTFTLIFTKFVVQKRHTGGLTRIIGVFVVLWHYLEQFYQEDWTPNCIADSFQEQLFVLRP